MIMNEQLKNALYLQCNSSVDRVYLDVSRHLKGEGIQLLPIECGDVAGFIEQKKTLVVAVVRNFEAHKNFMTIQKRLGFWLSTNAIELIHVSSFGELSLDPRTRKFKNYHFIRVPFFHIQLIDEVGDVMAKMTRNKEQNTWPGGRRAKLPQNL